MRGNSQVRFLGEKKAVMPFSYPTEYATKYEYSLTLHNAVESVLAGIIKI
jgi:hypothetical protein